MKHLSRLVLVVVCVLPLLWQPVRAAEVQPLAPGQLAPAFTLPRLNGSGDLSLASFRGKVVYLDFWASWCKPCRDAMPAFEQLYQQYRKQGLVIIGVNLDEEADWARKFLRKTGVSYPVAMDPHGATPTTFGLRRMPTAFMLDRSGRIRYVHEGFRPQDLPGITKQVVELLGEGR